MVKLSNMAAFYAILGCMGIAAYSLYSNLNHTWLIAPPTYILLLISLVALIFGFVGWQDKRNWQTKTRSWFTVILSSLTTIALFLAVSFTAFFSIGESKQISSVRSPDNQYTIDFYQIDPGATGSVGVRGEINGPLWFKKHIYYQDEIEQVDVEWENNHTVSINDHVLDLNSGDTLGY
ncbi:hypothetical protein F9U64_10820 [Gracilibacillus oryzae]|uniref:Uncharacterized protein n=1 Tax=Gracilibacillus oryzae TaxID=1672701 RepID=A0A7C8KZ64_9BACI|nr:DUF5412 family protein [Gracilibacillus oryzae]KAB8135756.1 hypothetical protein F9U64_10820 [Gracilibacillus oryzae]